MRHTLLALCCIAALVGFPTVTLAEDPAFDEITIEHDRDNSVDDDAFRDRSLTVGIDDELQAGDNQNKSDDSSGDNSQSDADVGICVVGAGGPCN